MASASLGVLAVALSPLRAEVFTELPRVNDAVTISRENGHDVAHPQEHDHGLER